MRLAIFGTTGTVGTALRAQALTAGHDARVLVRTPSKLGSEQAAFTVVEGNVKDEAAVKKTLLGCDAVLSTLGATSKDDPDTRRTGTTNILAAMRDASIRRLVVMGAFTFTARRTPAILGRS
jgi:putative NADH-flavin reductase